MKRLARLGAAVGFMLAAASVFTLVHVVATAGSALVVSDTATSAETAPQPILGAERRESAAALLRECLRATIAPYGLAGRYTADANVHLSQPDLDAQVVVSIVWELRTVDGSFVGAVSQAGRFPAAVVIYEPEKVWPLAAARATVGIVAVVRAWEQSQNRPRLPQADL